MPDYVAHLEWIRRTPAMPGSVPSSTHPEKILASGTTVYPFSVDNEEELKEILRVAVDTEGSRGGPTEIRVVKCWEIKREVRTKP